MSRLLSLLKFVSNCAFDFRYVDKVRLIVLEDFILLTYDLWSINIVALQSLQHSLVHLGLMDSLVSCKLEVGVFLCDCTELHALNIADSLFKCGHVDGTIGYFCHLLNLLLHLVLRGPQTILQTNLRILLALFVHRKWYAFIERLVKLLTHLILIRLCLLDSIWGISCLNINRFGRKVFGFLWRARFRARGSWCYCELSNNNGWRVFLTCFLFALISLSSVIIWWLQRLCTILLSNRLVPI